MNRTLSILLGVFLGLLFVAPFYIAMSAKRSGCTDYAEQTGRETKWVHGECYVRTGDHFVPRSEYGRQP